MKIRAEVRPFIAAAWAVGALLAVACAACGMAGCRAIGWGVAVAVVLCAYLIYFFRDPERTPPGAPAAIVAGADGTVARIADVNEDRYLKTDAVRISIFLSLFDVHVNRAPIAGSSSFLGYFPGKRYFTFQEKSSEFNQHNAILIQGDGTRCLVNQIVGPVCRRVVYWPDPDRPTAVKKGERIGMMKFGSRLDMLFPRADVEVIAKPGDRVCAGETVVARIRGEGGR